MAGSFFSTAVASPLEKRATRKARIAWEVNMVVIVDWRISMVQEGEDEVTEIAAGMSVGDYTS